MNFFKRHELMAVSAGTRTLDKHKEPIRLLDKPAINAPIGSLQTRSLSIVRWLLNYSCQQSNATCLDA